MIIKEIQNQKSEFSLGDEKILIVGLGNPGEKYSKTWHNVGFEFIDYLLRKEGITTIPVEKKFNAEFEIIRKNGHKFYVAKPQTFMNNSGESVRQIVKFYDIQLENIILVHDDLDIEFGKYKISIAKGPKIHNGVNSVESSLYTSEFKRVRIGIETRSSEMRKKFQGSDYVLSRIPNENQLELETIFESILAEIF